MKKQATRCHLLLVAVLAWSGLFASGCDSSPAGGANTEPDLAIGFATPDPDEEAAAVAAFNAETSQAVGMLDFDVTPTNLDLDDMAANIDKMLNGSIRDPRTRLRAIRPNAVGYAYAITQNGQLQKTKGAGWARIPADGGLVMKSTSRITVASVTKPVTAVATLQLIEANGLSIDDPVGPWLPEEWVQDSDIWGPNGVTFRHLLTHSAGFQQVWDGLIDYLGEEVTKQYWGNGWDGLEWLVSYYDTFSDWYLGDYWTGGVFSGAPSEYKNANFALLRVVIPALWKATGSHPGIGEITSFNAGFWYLAYVQQRIFVPAGVNSVSCLPQGSYDEAMAYNVNNLGIGGKLSSTPIADCGGHAGLHLSSLDLARFMVHIRYNDAVLSPQMRQLMDTHSLGWWGNDGAMRWHGGLLFVGGGREVNTCIMKYPNNVEATLVINSSENAPASTCGILKVAYEAAL